MACKPDSGNKRSLHNHPSLFFDKTPIEVVKESKFLGIIFDNKLSLIPHLKKVKAKYLKLLDLLKVLASSKWDGDETSLLHIYKSLIHSKLDYRSFIYGSSRPSCIEVLDTVHQRLSHSVFHLLKVSLQRFEPDADLSELMTRLWELDDNKCNPGEQYEIDLQGYVTSKNINRDFASDKLFTFLDEETVFERPTYKAFYALLDNYELETSVEELVTWEERRENWEFLELIMDTKVMQEAHRILVERGKAPEDPDDFKKLLHDIWFKLYKRRGYRGADSCSFEHVFVGEGDGKRLIGMHNWIQFYLQEKAGNINYHGFFRKDTVTDNEVPRLIALQFTWKGVKGKPMCSCFLGSSPEFEIAAYTLCLLLEKNGRNDCEMGEYKVEIVVHSFGHHTKLGTAYIAAARLY